MLLTRAGRGAIGAFLFSLVIIISPAAALAQVATSTATTTINTPALDPHNSADVELAVKSYFADVPVMAAIAKCESRFRQYTDSGAVLNGGSGGMIGLFQINKSVHSKFALTLGYDITTLMGNMQYARYLYTNEGTTPWNSSKYCWSKESLPAAAVSAVVNIVKSATLGSTLVAQASTNAADATPKASSNAITLNQNLKLGSVSGQVIALQKLLNSAGYVVAKTGSGSVGDETDTFGAMTKAAVQRFQCAKNIVCSGSEATTGYGYVGAKTRAALMVE